MKRKNRLILDYFALAIVFCLVTQAAMAFENKPAVLDLRFQPKVEHVFTLTPEAEEESAETIPLMLARIEPAAAASDEPVEEAKFKSDDDRDFKDKLIEKIPFGDKMHRSWKIIDGDVDLFIPGLRADRRNQGLEYSSTKIPLLGDMEKSEWKVDAGDDIKFTFESKALPFVDDVEGFHFKTSIGKDDTRAYARYTYKFD